MKNYHELQQKIFSLRRSQHKSEQEIEKLKETIEKLEDQIDEYKGLMQTHLPSRKEFFLWQEGSGKRI